MDELGEQGSSIVSCCIATGLEPRSAPGRQPSSALNAATSMLIFRPVGLRLFCLPVSVQSELGGDQTFVFKLTKGANPAPQETHAAHSHQGPRCNHSHLLLVEGWGRCSVAVGGAGGSVAEPQQQ